VTFVYAVPHLTPMFDEYVRSESRSFLLSSLMTFVSLMGFDSLFS